MKNYIKYFVTVLIVLIVAFLFYKKVYIPKTTYKIIKPKIGDLIVSVRGIGNIDAKDIYPVTAQTGGKILKILTDEGRWVKKGDLLVEMDGVDLQDKLQMAKSNLKKTKFDIKASKSELESLKAKKMLIDITYKRIKHLFNQGFATKEEFDKESADLKSINASIESSKAKIKSLKEALAVDKKNIDAYKQKIKRLKVYSPVDGYVISKDAQNSQTVAPQMPILKIVDPKTLWVKTNFDERVSTNIKTGLKAVITIRSKPNKKFYGFVKRVEPMSDLVTLERVVDIAFEKIPKPFFINEQAEVKIFIKKYHNVLKVPFSVVVQKGDKIGLWILKNGKAHFLKIEKIAQNSTETAIKNIGKSIKIIVPNPLKKSLHEGMRIHI